MTGDLRRNIENSKIDFLISNHQNMFKCMRQDYSFFAYNCYFFYYTQKQSKKNDLFNHEGKLSQISNQSVASKKLKARKKLHVTCYNYWSLKQGGVVERTIESFGLSYSDRNFLGLIVAPSENIELAKNINYFLTFRVMLQILKVLLFSIVWVLKLLLFGTILNGKLSQMGLPSYPFFHLIVKLYKLKIYEIIAKYYLKKSNYEEIYFSNYYSLKSLAICSAAKGLGMKTINLQHGIQGRLHPGFNFRAFKSESLPSYVPDEFYCYFLNEDHNMDHPELTIKLIVFEHKTLLANINKNVLITLHPSFYYTEDMLNELKRLATNGWHIYFKLHPRANPQINSIQILCKGENISLLPHMLHINEALQNVGIHVTGFSSSAIDAAAVGVKTYFLDDRAPDLYPSLISSSHAELCLSMSELITKLLLDD